MLDSDIKTLIKILEESNIDELEVSTFWGRQKICLRKTSSVSSQNIDLINNTSNQIAVEDNIQQNHATMTETAEVIQSEQTENVIEQEPPITNKNNITIKSPLVGTFYMSPKPDAPPYISEGDEIKIGQIICVIEAMKIFNEIESEYSGKIIKILVKDATPVEYDQDLLIISTE